MSPLTPSGARGFVRTSCLSTQLESPKPGQPTTRGCGQSWAPPVQIQEGPSSRCAYDLTIFARPRGLRMSIDTISSKTQPFQKDSTRWFSSTSSE